MVNKFSKHHTGCEKEQTPNMAIRINPSTCLLQLNSHESVRLLTAEHTSQTDSMGVHCWWVTASRCFSGCPFRPLHTGADNSQQMKCMLPAQPPIIWHHQVGAWRRLGAPHSQLVLIWEADKNLSIHPNMISNKQFMSWRLTVLSACVHQHHQ